VYFSPARAAARAFFPAVVCFFGMAASVSGETLRIPPTKGHACRTAGHRGPRETLTGDAIAAQARTAAADGARIMP